MEGKKRVLWSSYGAIPTTASTASTQSSLPHASSPPVDKDGAPPPPPTPSSSSSYFWMFNNNNHHTATASLASPSNIPVLATCFSAALATGGPTYSFGLYGATLKASLHLTQSNLETLSSANFCAGLLSWIPGLAVDRLGPKKAMILGGSTMALFLMAYWLVARQIIHVEDYIIVPTLSVLGIGIFMSNSLVVGSLFKSIILSCGLGTKGAAVGAAKGYLGLGAGFYAALFDALRKPEETELDFFTMAAFFALGAIALPAVALLPPKGSEAQDVSLPAHYHVAYTGITVLALSVVGSSALFMLMPLRQSAESLNDEEEPLASHFTRATLLLLAWFGPIITLFFLPTNTIACVPDEEDRMAVYSPSKPKPDQLKPQQPRQHCPSSRECSTSTERIVAAASPGPEDGHNCRMGTVHCTLSEMLGTSHAYLLLWSCTIVVGAGTMLTNNVGQMVEARGLPNRAAGACLALFSVSQAAARVATGAISERALSWKLRDCTSNSNNNTVIPRPVFLILSCLIGCLGHLWLAVTDTRGMFVVGVVLVGCSFGMVWPLMVLIVGDIFGTTHHGANYMFFDGFTSAIGTLVISKYIAQAVYEDNIEVNDNKTTCYGPECFQLTHLIVALLCFSALICSMLLSHLTKSRYHSIE